MPAQVLAAAVTPFGTDGGAPDEAGIEALAAFYASSDLDGVLLLGTTGEGVLLSVAERRAVAARFMAAARSLRVIVHCGAQSTRDTSALAAHCAELGAAAVAVIPPPYYALDGTSILRHLRTAAEACAPLPFFVYEFAARSGYAVPLDVLEALRTVAPNFVGMKVSDAPFELVQPYLLPGLEVFIGAEGLIHQGLAAGAAGAVSGLAAALPEPVVAAVRNADAASSARAEAVRSALQRFPFHAALKRVLQRRGVAVGGAVRAPLRELSAAEAMAVDSLVDQLADTIHRTAVSAVNPSR